ncbi:hypothetical protein CHS0354_038894 [Potamilus streckersoni]|uniref:Uncharacterized protein n=1 Tax=Potamilus streckersoni TaxID=2493646 RepID=A0AAE0T1D5_9BIVA|nr:hypothetical protein CHS0354_038894 [Potamilus streckersoni]
MPSKKERLHLLAQIWSTPTPFDLDFFDKGKEVVVVSSYRDIVVWWLRLFQRLLPQELCKEKNDIIKITPAPSVTLKLNKRSGILKVYGKNHWRWLVDEFPGVLEHGNDDVESLPDASDTSVTRFLQLDKNLEEVQDLIDMIPEGGGIMMHDFIMRIWKSLIDDWFGCGAVVYIVTPLIDEERLFQLFLLMIKSKGTGFHITLATPEKNQNGQKFSKIVNIARRMMKKTRTPRTQKRLVSDVKMQWAMENLNVHHQQFSTNFIAAYKDDEAEVFTTTAHFHKSHFHTNQKDNVCYLRMATEEMQRNYLFPLGISQVNY